MTCPRSRRIGTCTPIEGASTHSDNDVGAVIGPEMLCVVSPCESEFHHRLVSARTSTFTSKNVAAKYLRLFAACRTVPSFRCTCQTLCTKRKGASCTSLEVVEGSVGYFPASRSCAQKASCTCACVTRLGSRLRAASTSMMRRSPSISKCEYSTEYLQSEDPPN